MSSLGEIRSNQIIISEIHTNTDLTLIQITEDKLRLVLLEHLELLQCKSRWQVPLGILLALVPMFLTSEFKDFATVDKATWRAFFMFASLAAIVWLLMSLRWALKSVTLNVLVQRIKNIARKEG